MRLKISVQQIIPPARGQVASAEAGCSTRHGTSSHQYVGPSLIGRFNITNTLPTPLEHRSRRSVHDTPKDASQVPVTSHNRAGVNSQGRLPPSLEGAVGTCQGRTLAPIAPAADRIHRTSEGQMHPNRHQRNNGLELIPPRQTVPPVQAFPRSRGPPPPSAVVTRG